MKPRAFRTDDRRPGQRGLSLVELMVGLTLSMICVVALMLAYKAMVQGTQSMVANTTQTSQGAGLAVSLPRLIQQAGWGAGPTASPPGGAANTDVVLLGTSTLSVNSLTGVASTIGPTAQSGTALVWSTAVTGTVQCWALAASGGGVALLGPTACTAASDWSSLTWAQRADLAPPNSFASFQIQASTGTCWPYGGGPGAQPAVIVTLSGFGSTANRLCLSNIPR